MAQFKITKFVHFTDEKIGFSNAMCPICKERIDDTIHIKILCLKGNHNLSYLNCHIHCFIKMFLQEKKNPEDQYKYLSRFHSKCFVCGEKYKGGGLYIGNPLAQAVVHTRCLKKLEYRIQRSLDKNKDFLIAASL